MLNEREENQTRYEKNQDDLEIEILQKEAIDE